MREILYKQRAVSHLPTVVSVSLWSYDGELFPHSSTLNGPSGKFTESFFRSQWCVVHSLDSVLHFVYKMFCLQETNQHMCCISWIWEMLLIFGDEIYSNVLCFCCSKGFIVILSNVGLSLVTFRRLHFLYETAFRIIKCYYYRVNLVEKYILVLLLITPDNSTVYKRQANRYVRCRTQWKKKWLFGIFM